MAAKTDFNVTPYWDDFDTTDNFYRVLFRPGFAVQARELTQLQTILQNQIEQFGNHVFKEGAIVIPGSIGYDNSYHAIKVQSTFSVGTVSDYLSQYDGAVITGTTSGVTAQVVGYSVADSTTGDPDTLFVKYINTSTADNSTVTFTNNEYISADKTVSSYAAGVNSSQLYASNASHTGHAITVLAGIYFVRGFMVQNTEQKLVLDKYVNNTSWRIGWTISETLVTPESEQTLVDNAQGTTNYAAKGAHRFQLGLTLSAKSLTDTNDGDFIELARIEKGKIVNRVKYTEYSVVQDMIARRTDDESGDYIVRHFDIEPREHLDSGTNRGIYSTTVGGDETKTVLSVSPGKAYVNGYEVELQSNSLVDVDKARTSKNIQNDSVPFSLGNYAKVQNVYGQPDITEDASVLDPFKEVKLYDQQTTTRGTSNGSWIGLARTRAFEHNTGTIGTHSGATAAIFHHYLFDISMFNAITVSNNNTLTANAVITGTSSGATGIVVAAITTSTDFHVMQQKGDFLTGEAFTSSVSGDTVAGTIAAATNTTAEKKNFSRDVKQIFMDTSTGLDYTGDLVLDSSKTLTGQVTWTTGTTVNANNTEFTQELVVGDVVAFPSGAAAAQEERRIVTITNDTTIVIDSALSNAITSVSMKRLRGKVSEEEETVLVYKMPKDDIKTLLDSGSNSDTSYAYRKQFRATTTAGGVATFTLPAGQTWTTPSLSRNYTVTVTDLSPSGTALTGDIVDISGTATGSGTITLTITDATVIGANTDIELMGTVNIAIANHRTKTANKMKSKAFASNTGAGTYQDVFGERIGDLELSLSYADVYTLHAVYESSSIGTAAVVPTLTVTDNTGVFEVGEIITGSISGATGRLISLVSTTVSYVKIAGNLTALDTITGGSTGYTAKVTATTPGDRNITSSFLLDTGQRDSFYDLGRIARKPDAQTPTGQLTVIYDYFTHGTGDYFSVDSYNGQVDYKDIPQYVASKVDPESRTPVGFYQLRDSLDFRPRVNDLITPTSTPFAFTNKNFEAAGAVNGNLVQPDGDIILDFDYYLARRDLLFLTGRGVFEVMKGIPAENPEWPETDNINMLVSELTIPPYTYKPEDVQISYLNNKGYRMKDIGKLETRIAKLEYATTLGLLERETDSYMVLDSDGNNRFKSGFVVDNFYGHNVGNSQHTDYQAAVDAAQGHLRPISVQSGIDLIEENTTDAARTNDHYQKTGDLITLPYTEVAEITQPYASRVESVNPYSVVEWIGHIDLAPATDVWMDEDRIPALTINVEGNYEQLLRENTASGALGTQWGAWNDIWTGNRQVIQGGRNWQEGGGGGIRQVSQSAMVSVDVQQRRTGTNTRLVERISTQDTGDRVTNVEVVPWIRARDVNFVARNLKPNTRVYAFFDKVDVNADVKPTGGSANNTTLSSAIDKTAVTIPVVSTTDFPATGTIGIGNESASDDFGISYVRLEQMTYTGKTATTFTGVTRNTTGDYDEAQDWASGVAVTNQTYGTQMVTDSVGTLSGRFKIPNTDGKRFRIGRRTFRLTDNDSNSSIVGMVNTSANAEYMAIGHKQTKQQVIVATRNGEIVVDNLEETTAVFTRTTGGEVSRGAWYDPLAQTIMIDREGGAFVTSCDIFFSHKDDSLPVWMEIRTVVNGYPTNEILPFSKKTLETGGVTVNTTDATTATRFTFDSPVYLLNGKEYALVLASNSPNYKVWISRLGEVEIGGARTISSQPTLGSLFKSQNASTWTASQYEDLKFTLNRATFDKSSKGTFSVVNEEMVEAAAGNGLIPILKENPIEASNATTKIKVNFVNHGNVDVDSNVRIAGVKSDIGGTQLDGGITNAETTVVCDDISNFPAAGGTVKIDNELITYTGVTGIDTLVGCTRGTANWDGVATAAVAHVNNTIVELYMFGGIPLIEINKTHIAVADLELDSFTVSTSTPATSTVKGGGSNVRCTKNILADVMHPIIQTMELPNTVIDATMQTTTSRSINSSTQNAYARTSITNAEPIPLNKDHYFDSPQLIASQINETNEIGGYKSYTLNIGLTSTLENVSPVIDTQRMFNICVSNRLNQVDSSSDIGTLSNYNSMTEATGDNHTSVYITKKITLANGATALKIYFDAVRQADADVKVLFKIQRPDSAVPFEDQAWTFFNTTGAPDSAVTLSKNRQDFKEYTYFAGTKQNGLGDPLDEFNAFAVKIVMRGKNSSLPPILKDFRAVALAT